MKIIRITGDAGVGKTTLLRAFRDIPTLQGSFLELTGRAYKNVKQELERLNKSAHLETRVTVLIDYCEPDIEALLEEIVCNKAVAVIIPEPHVGNLAVLQDAERYRHIRHHVVGARSSQGKQRFVLPEVETVAGTNIMRGSVGQHFDKAVDAFGLASVKVESVAAEVGR